MWRLKLVCYKGQGNNGEKLELPHLGKWFSCFNSVLNPLFPARSGKSSFRAAFCWVKPYFWGERQSRKIQPTCTFICFVLNKWGNRGPERGSNLLQVTQLFGVRTPSSWSQPTPQCAQQKYLVSSQTIQLGHGFFLPKNHIQIWDGLQSVFLILKALQHLIYYRKIQFTPRLMKLWLNKEILLQK